MKKQFKRLMCDFETTVYKGQVNTEVWASACVELFTEDVKVFHSIGETFEYFKSLKCNLVCYYHNLKFDGSFWLSYLICDLNYTQAYIPLNQEATEVEWMNEKQMPNNSFKYSISEKGQWYTITIMTGGKIIEIRDSLKLLPFSVKRIGKAFGTKHQKLEMEYEGFRYAGCTITSEEQKYIANDVLVMKEALEIMFTEGHTALTIGSCCLQEYKRIVSKFDYERMFPDLTEISIDPGEHRYDNADAWIRKSYKGGWCYLARGKENQLKHNGTTADVNSLYPSMMSSESGNYYPIGLPHFWTGNEIPEKLKDREMFYYFVRVRTRFYLKPGKLPFIQIKGNPLYIGTEALETSDVYDKKTGKYYPRYRDGHGNLHEAIVELTLTCTDWELVKEHYELVDCTILDGCYFLCDKGIFDEYIEKYKKIKLESKGAKRELAKLFLNNLYGKMASSTDSSFKVAFKKDNGALSFLAVPEHNKKPGFIAVGSAITSYARNFTIRVAQKNYYGADKPGFIYADTDSIHCDLPPEEIKGITVHDKNFCCWKLESCWDVAIFARQKTYIEHVTHENLQPIEAPYFNVKCAGMPDTCKNLFIRSMEDRELTEDEKKSYNEEQLQFLSKHRTMEDFAVGLIVPGKLMPKRIPGGVLLVETTYQMR